MQGLSHSLGGELFLSRAAKLAGHFADVLPRLDDMGLTENASNLFGYDGVKFAVLQG